MQYSVFSSSTEENLITINVLTPDNNGSYIIDPSIPSDLLTAYEDFRSVIGTNLLSDLVNTDVTLEFYVYAPTPFAAEKNELDYQTLSPNQKVTVDLFINLSIEEISE